MNNVPGVVYRGMPDWTMPVLGADIERFIGYPAEEFTPTGKPWFEIVLPGRPGHGEGAHPGRRPEPRAGPPAGVPPPAPGRFRPVGGGPAPDDLRRGWEAAVGRRPCPRHHRSEAIGRRVAPHPVQRRPGKRNHLLDGAGRPTSSTSTTGRARRSAIRGKSSFP